MTQIKICTGRACSDHGSDYLFDRFKAEKNVRSTPVSVEPCACLGSCRDAVNLKVETKNQSTIYPQMTGPKLAQLLKKLDPKNCS